MRELLALALLAGGVGLLVFGLATAIFFLFEREPIRFEPPCGYRRLP